MLLEGPINLVVRAGVMTDSVLGKNSMDIVVTGTTGKLGGYLQHRWEGPHRVHRLARNEVDLRDQRALRRVLERIRFDALVNCAAVASPEACESLPSEAYLVNRDAPGVMAEVCREKGARLLHFSTDYVLDGREPGLKDETAKTAPVNHYGKSKLAGEHRILDEYSSALVCRTSWIFGTVPFGFLQTVLKRARGGEILEFVANKWSMPSDVSDLAEAAEMLLDRREVSGVIHLTNLGRPESWWSYAKRVIEIAVEEGVLAGAREVRPSAMADIPQLSAPRPVHTAMTPARLQHELGWRVRGWEEAAREYIRSLEASGECH